MEAIDNGVKSLQKDTNEKVISLRLQILMIISNLIWPKLLRKYAKPFQVDTFVATRKSLNIFLCVFSLI